LKKEKGGRTGTLRSYKKKESPILFNGKGRGTTKLGGTTTDLRRGEDMRRKKEGGLHCPPPKRGSTKSNFPKTEKTEAKWGEKKTKRFLGEKLWLKGIGKQRGGAKMKSFVTNPKARGSCIKPIKGGRAKDTNPRKKTKKKGKTGGSKTQGGKEGGHELRAARTGGGGKAQKKT